MLPRTALLLCLGVGMALMAAQAQTGSESSTLVDAQGVWRWTSTGAEVARFGVNYTTPFAHAYRAHRRRDIDLRQAIVADVAHLARLRLDAFRIHVWDRELTDRRGNLIENEHLDLLDFLIAQLKARAIDIILTPIAWWGTGYPEPDPKTGGFSDYYTKCELTADTAAWRIQANYLQQFILHVNPYTGLSYRDDPDILAIELFNEPCHETPPEITTQYINFLVDVLRGVGLRKPIFYNVSQGYTEAHGQAVCAAAIQGITFQWYPTGLVRGRMLESNMLPNVDRYPMPAAEIPACQAKTRIVYEFDAADVGGSYMYPAMARSFRAAGFQWATQFAYDPLYIADANTEYPTHYVNLVYTPSKAISLMIAGEVFRHIPRGASEGIYPESTQFGPFQVNAVQDLSLMVTDTAFYYSNTTDVVPPRPELLRHIAGVGSSPVVEYEGTGAYFLDRLAAGVWRLEVYPDVFWVADPFGPTGLHRSVARLVARERQMMLRLPDLGTDFSVWPRNAGNTHRPAVMNGAFGIRPGVYILVARDTDHLDIVDMVEVEPFYVPPIYKTPLQVLHTPPEALVADTTASLSVQVVADAPVDSVLLFVRRSGWRGFQAVRMQPVGGDRYRAFLPASVARPGRLTYVITLYQAGQPRTFPANERRDPRAWDFAGRVFWHTTLLPAGAPLVLFDPARDADRLLLPRFQRNFRFSVEAVPDSEPEQWALLVNTSGPDPESGIFALRIERSRLRDERLYQAEVFTHLRVRARAFEGIQTLEIALIDQDGTAWGTTLRLSNSWRDYRIPVQTLQPVPLVLLPRPYPQFLPYFFSATPRLSRIDLTRIDGLQIGVRPAGGAAFALGYVMLER